MAKFFELNEAGLQVVDRMAGWVSVSTEVHPGIQTDNFRKATPEEHKVLKALLIGGINGANDEIFRKSHGDEADNIQFSADIGESMFNATMEALFPNERYNGYDTFYKPLKTVMDDWHLCIIDEAGRVAERQTC